MEIREKSADLLNNLRNDPSFAAVGMFLLVVFFYGILHGAGPGATMLLILALSQNLITMCVWGVLAMSLGMGIIISFAGYLGMTGRKSFFMWFKGREGAVGKISNIFKLLSYSLIALFSLWMGSPFIFWLISRV